MIYSLAMSTAPRPRTVLCLCSGNYCRSPLAEGLLGHHLRSGGYGGEFSVASAGTTDHHEGLPAAELVRQEVRRRTDREFDHRPHKVAPREIEEARLILAMAAEHREWIAREHPEALAKAVLLASAVGEKFDIPDPGVMEIGPLRETADLIERCVRDGLEWIVGRARCGAEGGI